MSLGMTVGEWSHRLAAVVGFTTGEAIEIMKMGLRKSRNAGVRMSMPT